MDRKELIRTIYLYIFSIVGLVLFIFGSVRLIDLGLKKFIFTKAEESIVYPSYPIKPFSSEIERKESEPTKEELEKYSEEQRLAQEKQNASNRARTASESLAMIIVGAPLFFYHWKTIQKTEKHKTF